MALVAIDANKCRDMREERRILNKTVLPQLEAVGRARGVKVSLVDLRWGIPTTEMDTVITNSLRGVEKCRPYFLCALGERYGGAMHASVGENPQLGAAFEHAVKEFPWLQKHRDKSVTELEIIFGAFAPQLSPRWHELVKDWGGEGGEAEAKRRLAKRCFFFLRDSLLITKHLGAGDERRADFEEETSEGYTKLSSLKDRVREGATSYHVVDGYRSYGEFSDTVTALLIQQIESDFPEVLQQTAGGGADEALAVPRPKLEKALLAHLQGNPLHPIGKKTSHTPFAPLVLLGPEGVGKASLLHQCCRQLRGNGVEVSWISERFAAASATLITGRLIATLRQVTKLPKCLLPATLDDLK